MIKKKIKFPTTNSLARENHNKDFHVLYIYYFFYLHTYIYTKIMIYNAVLKIAFLLQSLYVIKYLKNIQFKWMNNTNMDKLNI